VLVIFGVWLALAGAVSALTGLTGLRRQKRLRTAGRTAWATVVVTPSDPEERSAGSSQLVSVQFALDDERIVERACRQPGRGSAALDPGRRVLVWYDPADPQEVLIYGRPRRRSDLAFIVVGLLLIAAGASVAVY